MAQTAARAFLNELDSAGVNYELIPHEHTETALAEAEAVGVEPSYVAKTIILVTRRGFIRAVLPASRRLDLNKVRDLLDAPGARLATEKEIRDVPGLRARRRAAVRWPARPGAHRRTVVCARVGRDGSRLPRRIGAYQDEGPHADHGRTARRPRSRLT